MDDGPDGISTTRAVPCTLTHTIERYLYYLLGGVLDDGRGALPIGELAPGPAPVVARGGS